MDRTLSMQLTFSSTLRGRLASAQENMKLSPSLVAGCRSLAGGPPWYREGGIAYGETRDSLAESQVAAREGPSKHWIARHGKRSSG